MTDWRRHVAMVNRRVNPKAVVTQDQRREERAERLARLIERMRK